MLLNEVYENLKYFIASIAILASTLLFPVVTEASWYNMIVKIREAIITGDSGNLILSAASNSILFALQNTLVFLAVAAVFLTFVNSYNKITNIMHVITFISVNMLIANLMNLPWESLTSILGAILILFLVQPSSTSGQSLFRFAMISIQIFFALQWLNVMPMFSGYQFGTTDIPSSIKITSVYLQSDPVLNFVGMAFFAPLYISAVITSILFISYDRNISIAEENHQKEKALDTIKSKAMENRIYQEINALTHDLKTPLVTIRGLNSLLSISQDKDKISVYTERIEGAVEKMSEMISSFLYSSSKQTLYPHEIIDYIRAQIPVEHDLLNFSTETENDLSPIYVNKVRVVRAFINLIENSIVAPTNYQIKEIKIRAFAKENGIIFEVIDNGIGIPKSILDHIWTLGFSTNNTSGMGLSFARKVIEDNNGSITLNSTENLGTTVSIFFPCFDLSKPRKEITYENINN